MARNEQMEAYIEAIEVAATWHKRSPIEQAECDRAAAGAFPGGPKLKAGDRVLHPESGRCQVVKFDDALVYLMSDNGKSIELGLDTTVFAPHSIAKGNLRVFSMLPKILF